MAMALLEHGVNVDNSDNSGATALVESVSANHHKLLCALLDRGASPNVQLPHNENILHIIAKSADLQTITLLGWLEFARINKDQMKVEGPKAIDILKA